VTWDVEPFEEGGRLDRVTKRSYLVSVVFWLAEELRMIKRARILLVPLTNIRYIWYEWYGEVATSDNNCIIFELLLYTRSETP